MNFLYSQTVVPILPAHAQVSTCVTFTTFNYKINSTLCWRLCMTIHVTYICLVYFRRGMSIQMSLPNITLSKVNNTPTFRYLYTGVINLVRKGNTFRLVVVPLTTVMDTNGNITSISLFLYLATVRERFNLACLPNIWSKQN